MPDQSTIMPEARENRIARRLAIIKALTNPTNFRLVQRVLNANEPLLIDLDFAAQEFPGRYVYELIDNLTSLQELGIVTMRRTRQGQTEYSKGDIWQQPQDTVAVEFVEMLYR